ncbi:D-alanine--D-alanine ligase [Candidatus Nomurabacteria bacterium]|nr:D-alanine--D-alanine ligase [Candidatus Nomurabacteria bacterium]
MRTVVGVLRGGPSSEYEVSLKTGASVLEHIDKDSYDPRDLFVDRSGQWHSHGLAVEPHQALHGIDVVFNAMHGEYGEDGHMQRLLDSHAVRYTGSGALASSLAFNKHLTKQAAKKLGVKLAHSIVVDRQDPMVLAQTIFRTFPHPAVVKPVAAGSSVGVTVAHDFKGLVHALETAFALSERALVEEFIKGREATVGVIDNFRGERVYALMPVEIIPPAGKFFDYEHKYNGATQEIVPGNFSHAEKDELARMAKAVHEGLNLAHYSRSDFIVSRRGIYFLEVNTLPGLTSESLLPKAVKAGGSSLKEFISHVIELAKR